MKSSTFTKAKKASVSCPQDSAGIVDDIMAGSFAIRQLKTILTRSLFPIKFQAHQIGLELGLRLDGGF